MARLKSETVLPFCSGKDENKADEALGEVMRHNTGELPGAAIGVVDSIRAKEALVCAYAEMNGLRVRLAECEEKCNEYRTHWESAVGGESVSVTQTGDAIEMAEEWKKRAEKAEAKIAQFIHGESRHRDR